MKNFVFRWVIFKMAVENWSMIMCQYNPQVTKTKIKLLLYTGLPGSTSWKFGYFVVIYSNTCILLLIEPFQSQYC